jgi:hypothetical protein
MLRLVRNNWLTLECNPADCWVGVYWERKRTHYCAGEGIVTAELHVWVCLVPCFPLHFIHTMGLIRLPAGDELRRAWGFLPIPP